VAINHLQVKEELLNKIRSADIISTTLRGVTTDTDTFDGDDNETQFTLTNDGIKNIRSVVVDSTTLTPFVDYTYTLTEADATNKIITFTVAPGTGTDNIEIEYDYSSTGDLIYDDYNMTTIKSEDKFPRIAFDIISESTKDKALQGAVYQSSLLFRFSAFGRGRNETETINNDLRDYILSLRPVVVSAVNKLQRLNYIAIRGRDKMEPWLNGKTQKIFRKDLNGTAPFEFDV